MALAKEYEQDGRVLILAPESLYGLNTLSRSFEGLERMYRAGYAAAEAIPAFLELKITSISNACQRFVFKLRHDTKIL